MCKRFFNLYGNKVEGPKNVLDPQSKTEAETGRLTNGRNEEKALKESPGGSGGSYVPRKRWLWGGATKLMEGCRPDD